MTTAPTPQPDHGAAGFCTDHAQVAARFVDFEFTVDRMPTDEQWMAAMRAVDGWAEANGLDVLGFASHASNDRGETFRTVRDERDAAHAALDRVRAICAQIEAMPIPADPGMSQMAITGRIVATITRAVRDALDPEEPR